MSAEFDNDEEIYEKPKRGTVRPSRPIDWITACGPIIVAIIGGIALLLSVLIRTPDKQGTPQPIIIVALQTVFGGQGGNLPTATPTLAAPASPEATTTATLIPTNTPIIIVITATIPPTFTQTPTITPSIVPTEKPTNTKLPAPTKTEDHNPRLYDDFNNSQYNGRFNTALWGSNQSLTDDVKQLSGRLQLLTTDTTDENGYTIGFLQLNKDTLISLQAKMMISSRTNKNGNMTFTLMSDSLPGGWLETGLYRFSDGNWSTLVQVPGVGQLVTKPIQPDTWYTIRVNFEKTTSTFTVFLDDKQLTSYKAPTSVTVINPILQIWRSNKGVNIEAYIDDVYTAE